MTQLTDDPAGVPDGAISADGEFVYYLRDKGGNEIGHYARIPFAGGEPEDMTPNLPEYASHFLAESASGNRLGFSAVDDGGFHIYVFDKSRMNKARIHNDEAGFILRSDPLARRRNRHHRLD